MIGFEMAATIRQVAEKDCNEWAALFEAYCKFGGGERTSEMRDRVWGWIQSPTAQTRCFVAENDQGKIVGFVHFGSYERPMPAIKGAYIDDVFVGPSARGQGMVD